MSRRSIVNRLTSDKPVGTVALDPPGLRRIAKGISGFLRNKNTYPPLTLAVCGEWGSGKTSVLSLLREDLHSQNMPVVWFRAWQEGTEQGVLAAVFQRLGESVPPWWSLRGIVFHGRLLAIRIVHRRRLLLCSAAIVALVSGYLAVTPNGSLLASLSAWLPNWQVVRYAGLSLWIWMIAAAPVLALLISLADLFLKGGTLSGRVKRAELVRQGDFRGRLAEDFRDLIAAFRPRTLTLLIDDLDRCPPKLVVNVLEAVNFLVSAGDCFVVIGMMRAAVERSIGLHLSTLAEQIRERDEENKAEESRTVSLRAQSARYLDSLINVEVALPALDVERAWDPILFQLVINPN